MPLTRQVMTQLPREHLTGRFGVVIGHDFACNILCNGIQWCLQGTIVVEAEVQRCHVIMDLVQRWKSSLRYSLRVGPWSA